MINRKRIRKLNPYRAALPATDTVYVTSLNPTEVQLKRAGFSIDVADGETILPVVVGRATLFNSEGKQVIRRDKPMETAYRVVEWHWKQWSGRGETIERSEFRDVPYKRYPRDFIEPPALELTFMHDTDGNTAVIGAKITDWKDNENILVHAINVFLELFGECVVLDESKEQALPTDLRRVNWRILPKGEYPFSRIRDELKPVINRNKPGNRSFVNKRLERLNSFEPEFTVLGQKGFTGYVIMAYPDRNLYVLESLVYGNATYVLEKDWQVVSKLTKAEILQESLHKQRIIHRRSWFSKIKTLFVENPVR
jgi:hypothetical protein